MANSVKLTVWHLKEECAMKKLGGRLFPFQDQLHLFDESDYEKVAEIEIDNARERFPSDAQLCEVAYSKTQSYDKPWFEDSFLKAFKKTRSTSMGDAVSIGDVNCPDDFYVCQDFGFEKLVKITMAAKKYREYVGEIPNIWNDETPEFSL